MRVNYITKWIAVIFIVAIVCSFFTTACRETEDTERSKVMLEIEREKTDQMKIENGLPVKERKLTTENNSVN